MKRSARLFAVSALLAALFVVLSALTGFAAPPARRAPAAVAIRAAAQAPAQPPATIGGLVQERSDSRAAQAQATSARDAAQKAYADAQAALATTNDRVGKADTRLAKGLGQVGPVLIGGTVYELAPDGTVRSFQPAAADTPVDLGDEGPAPTPNPDPAPAPIPDPAVDPTPSTTAFKPAGPSPEVLRVMRSFRPPAGR